MAKAVVRAGLVVVSLVWALAAQAVLAADLGSFVKEGSKAAGLSACVEPTEIMRRDHMELIEHQRDETVHGGIRGTKHSLAGCIDCHVSTGSDGQAVPANGPDQFCGACHAFAAVTVNCFDCHASVPNGGPVSEFGVAAHQAAGIAVAGGGPAVKGQ
jgi:hypothetical protein